MTKEVPLDPLDCLASAEAYAVPVLEGRLLSSYEVGKAVGKGGYAIVYKGVRREDGRIVAVKKVEVFEMAAKKRDRCLQEVKLLKSLSHPNVIQMLDAFIDENMLIIIFEWAPAGDLKRLIRKTAESGKRLDEPSIWAYFSQITGGLLYMHKERVMHRDIKPANVLVGANGMLKIGDLGLGRHLSEQTMEAFSKVGTPYYVSPEVIKGQGYDWKVNLMPYTPSMIGSLGCLLLTLTYAVNPDPRAVDPQSDVWSLGCLLYELAQLRSPFEVEGAGANLYDVFQKISKGDYEPLPLDSFSSQLRQLVGRMLFIDPVQRPELEDVWSFTQDILKSQLQATTRQDVHSTVEDLFNRLLFLEDHVLMQPSLPPPPVDALRSVHPLFLAESLGSSRGPAGATWDLAGEQKIQLGTVMSIFSWLLRLLGKQDLSETLEANLEQIPGPGEAAASLRKTQASWGGRGLEGKGVEGRGTEASSRTPPPSLPPPGPSAHTARGSSPASKTRPGRTLVASSSSSSRASTPPEERDGRSLRGDGGSLGRPPVMPPVPPTTPPRPSFSSSHELSGYLPSSRNILRGAGAMKKAAQAIGLETEFAPVQAIALGHGRAVCSLLNDVLLLVYQRIEPKTKAGLVGRLQHPSRPLGADEDDFIREMDEGVVMVPSDPLPYASRTLLDEDEEPYGYQIHRPGATATSTYPAGVSQSDPSAGGPSAGGGGVLQSRIDPVMWKQEMERAAPKLRILLGDAKDWRTNFDEVHSNASVISSSWPNARIALEKVRGELKESLERLGTRERHINDRFQGIMDGFRAQRRLLGEIQTRYYSRTEAVGERHGELHRIGEQLSEMKVMMDERGADISNATPVVRIRSAIKDLKVELRQMEVRLGVLKSQQLKQEQKSRMHMVQYTRGED